MKITTVRNEKEVEKICSESEEIKALREKINNAYLNKERIGQMAEKQYRQQREVEEDALMDVAMLRQKELEEIANQERLRREKEAAFLHKKVSSFEIRISRARWLRGRD